MFEAKSFSLNNIPWLIPPVVKRAAVTNQKRDSYTKPDANKKAYASVNPSSPNAHVKDFVKPEVIKKKKTVARYSYYKYNKS